MKKKVIKRSKGRSILLTLAAIIFIVFFLFPLSLSVFSGQVLDGNVALIPIEGMITGSGGSYLGKSTLSSQDMVNFIKQADQNEKIKVILLEINSPGGSAVASDEIAAAVKKTNKPVVALIREVGASGGYWIASAADHIIANRMSITGSIGVLSSYLEFSGLMDDYGVNYEKMVAGKYKDMGTPFRKLKDDERGILQEKLNKIHGFFIEEIVENRNLKKSNVVKISTGEFYLGVEALQLGLVDQLGDKDSAIDYIKGEYNIEEVSFAEYRRELGFFEKLSTVLDSFSFHVGEGLGSIFMHNDNNLMLI